jgi:hypothetical protein
LRVPTNTRTPLILNFFHYASMICRVCYSTQEDRA